MYEAKKVTGKDLIVMPSQAYYQAMRHLETHKRDAREMRELCTKLTNQSQSFADRLQEDADEIMYLESLAYVRGLSLEAVEPEYENKVCEITKLRERIEQLTERSQEDAQVILALENIIHTDKIVVAGERCEQLQKKNEELCMIIADLNNTLMAENVELRNRIVVLQNQLEEILENTKAECEFDSAIRKFVFNEQAFNKRIDDLCDASDQFKDDAGTVYRSPHMATQQVDPTTATLMSTVNAVSAMRKSLDECLEAFDEEMINIIGG